MSEARTKSCPFCKEQIREDAIKCRFCQSSLVAEAGPLRTEKLAEYVIKAVGVIPIMMTLLLVIAGVFGISSVMDVSKSTKRAEDAAATIESKSELIDKLSADVAELHIETLLNELNIDSKAAKAEKIRRELKELLDLATKHGPSEIQRRSVYFLAEALFDYYGMKYDEGLALLDKADDSVNKFRLGGALWLRKADNAKRISDAEAKKYYAKAYDQFAMADQIGNTEHRLLVKNKVNRALAAARLENYREAEAAWLEIFNKNLQEQDDYYLFASMYARWGKLDRACDYLEKGLDRGLAGSADVRKKDVSEDADFDGLRASKDPKIRARYAAIVKRLGD